MVDLFDRFADTYDPVDDHKYSSPGELAQALDPVLTIQTPALELIDSKLVQVAEGRCERLIISMAPQEGKSERVSRRFPTWMLTRNPDLRIALASYEFRTARRWGRVIRNDAVTHDLFRIDPTMGAANEWQIDGHIGGVYTVGIGGALTGRPVDLLVIDDPVKGRKEATSETLREDTWDWWTSTALSRLAPAAPVVLILTRWHEDDLAGRFLAEGGWEYLNIPAQADHDPARGQTDPLGRQPGEWLQSSRRRTTAQWEERKAKTPARDWISLYQGRPSPQSGDVFHREWWRRYETPIWSQNPDGSYDVPGTALLMSWDMTFKNTTGTDYVVGQVWAHRQANAYLVDQVRARLSFTDTVAAFRLLTAKWPAATAKLVEDTANGPAVISSLRNDIPGIVAIPAKDSKEARAAAVSPFVEAGNVWLPDHNIALFDVETLIEETLAFPNGSHDDQVDALSQALTRMLLNAGPQFVFGPADRTIAIDGRTPLAVDRPDGHALRPGRNTQQMVDENGHPKFTIT